MCKCIMATLVNGRDKFIQFDNIEFDKKFTIYEFTKSKETFTFVKNVNLLNFRFSQMIGHN
jgi:hypothetical protein